MIGHPEESDQRIEDQIISQFAIARLTPQIFKERQVDERMDNDLVEACRDQADQAGADMAEKPAEQKQQQPKQF